MSVSVTSARTRARSWRRRVTTSGASRRTRTACDRWRSSGGCSRWTTGSTCYASRYAASHSIIREKLLHKTKNFKCHLFCIIIIIIIIYNLLLLLLYIYIYIFFFFFFYTFIKCFFFVLFFCVEGDNRVIIYFQNVFKQLFIVFVIRIQHLLPITNTNI